MSEQQQTDAVTTSDSRNGARRPDAARTDATANERLLAADRRDAIADGRYRAALARDEAAAARDRTIAELDAIDEHENGRRAVTGAEIITRAAEQRRRAARYRARAAEHRDKAAEDRAAAAADREHSARDRVHAQADREALAAQVAVAETDVVTGARGRAAGLRELDREIERCLRTGGVMVVAYVEVTGLKSVNDSAGHSAGDELLRRVATTIRAHVRPYDLVIRLGGGEFVCAMPGMSPADARERFREITLELATGRRAAGIRTGFTELTPEDCSSDLVARADEAAADEPD